MSDEQEFKSVSDAIRRQLAPTDYENAVQEAAQKLIHDNVTPPSEQLDKLKLILKQIEENYQAQIKENIENKIKEKLNTNMEKLLLGGSGSIQNKPLGKISKRIKRYTIQAGKTIIVPTPRASQRLWLDTQMPGTIVRELRREDTEAIVTERVVRYTDEDVCMNPVTGDCTNPFLLNSSFARDHTYFGFTLPTNKKNIPFILVPRDAVEVVFSDVESFINETVKTESSVDVQQTLKMR